MAGQFFKKKIELFSNILTISEKIVLYTMALNWFKGK